MINLFKKTMMINGFDDNHDKGNDDDDDDDDNVLKHVHIPECDECFQSHFS